MESPYRRPVIHRVESCHLVNAHGRHLKYPSDFVHDTDASESMLALAEIKEGHDGGFLVLGWISF